MIEQTRAYRAALAQLSDALAQRDPAEVQLSEVYTDLADVLERRQPEFYAAMFAAYDDRAKLRKHAAVEKRRATLRRKAATQSGSENRP